MSLTWLAPDFCVVDLVVVVAVVAVDVAVDVAVAAVIVIVVTIKTFCGLDHCSVFRPFLLASTCLNT
eukprot:531770-Amphidinium_carterae.1